MKNVHIAVLALGLTGCGVDKRAYQSIAIDSNTVLLARVEGAPGGTVQTRMWQGDRQVEPIHRVFRDRAGKVIFAYDLVVAGSREAGYVYKFQPSEQGITLGGIQEVQVRGGESVSLDVLEDPKSGVRVTDVFRLAGRPWSARGLQRLRIELRNLLG